MADVAHRSRRRGTAEPEGLLLTSGEATYSFRCIACGKCCTSAPLVTVPELFLHRRRFIGCLGVRRVARAIDGITSGTLFPFTYAFDHAGSGRCPSLDSDGRCEVHAIGLPLACRVVPFDALVPDDAQAHVLDERIGDIERWNVNCLKRVEPRSSAPVPDPIVFRRLRVIGGEAPAALALHRAALRDEHRFWARALARKLSVELATHPEAGATLARGGVVTLALAPVILLLASASNAARLRCLEYVDGQIAFIERLLEGHAVDSQTAWQATAFARVHRAVRRALVERELPQVGRTPEEVSALEAWLGVSANTTAASA